MHHMDSDKAHREKVRPELLKKERNPQNVQHAKYLLVQHILINCNRVRQMFLKLYQTNNLKVFFKNTKLEEILGFLKENNLFIKI